MYFKMYNKITNKITNKMYFKEYQHKSKIFSYSKQNIFLRAGWDMNYFGFYPSIPWDMNFSFQCIELTSYKIERALQRNYSRG